MKSTITIGIVNEKQVVLKDPSDDVDAHIKFIRELTDNEGKISSGKSEKKVSEAVVVHSVKGTIKRRVFK